MVAVKIVSFLMILVPSAVCAAEPPVKEIQKFSESPRKNTSDPAMVEIANLGRQVSKLQKQIADLNQAAFDAGDRSQKIFLKVAELRFAGVSRTVKQAELELEASRLEGEAMALDKKISETQTKALLKIRAEMAEKSAGLRLRATEARAQAGALSIENSEAQMKMDRLFSDAHRESVAAAKARVSVAENERKVILLESKMHELANQSQAKPNNQNAR
ncbi:MAG: hypothetical protein U1E10_07990 [Bdellovibrionales bacterium]|nr:hypothetical protein [Bdellovibrionales bacterium]